MHQTVGTSGSSLLAVQEAAHLLNEAYQKLLTGEARELLDSTVDDAWKDGFEKVCWKIMALHQIIMRI